jgi:FkbM family methyltransferase
MQKRRTVYRHDDMADDGKISQGMKLDPAKKLKLMARSRDIEDQRACPLPEGAMWADVLIKGVLAFQMAVWAPGKDPVSNSILASGYWEVNDTSEFGTPGEAVDIGGQIGFYTFLLAYGAWNVTTFEPMDRNLAFIRATLCQNPTLASRIRLLPFGLGSKNEVCGMVAASHNVGNGIVQCSGDAELFAKSKVKFLPVVGSFQIRRLDEVVREQKISRIDFMKLDIEGYQCEVFRGTGGPVEFLRAYKPRLIRSEVWRNMQRCQSIEYFSWFAAAGYHNTTTPSDPTCKPAAPGPGYWSHPFDYYMCLAKP